MSNFQQLNQGVYLFYLLYLIFNTKMSEISYFCNYLNLFILYLACVITYLILVMLYLINYNNNNNNNKLYFHQPANTATAASGISTYFTTFALSFCTKLQIHLQLGAVLAAVEVFAFNCFNISRDISVRVLYFLLLDSLFVVRLCEVKICNERQFFCKPTSVQL